MKRHRTHNKAFSLIEIIVVVAIIGILSSIVLFSVNRARNRAVAANVTIAMNSLKNALALFQQDRGTWPFKVGDGRMVVTNNTSPDQGWNSFMAQLAPYMANRIYDLPYVVSGGLIRQGYLYLKGTKTNPVQISMFNGATGAYIGCIRIYEGYFFDANVTFPQDNFTLNDGGVDPDGIDRIEGTYTIDPGIPAASCPTTGVIF